MASDVKSENVQWLWPNRIPLGKLTIVAGDPGVGKSFLTLDIASRVSRGRSWPDGSCATVTPASVLLISAEDDAADTIVPRLEAAAADLGNIHIFDKLYYYAPEQDLDITIPFSLDSHLPQLRKLISKSYPKLVVIDPISAYLV